MGKGIILRRQGATLTGCSDKDGHSWNKETSSCSRCGSHIHFYPHTDTDNICKCVSCDEIKHTISTGDCVCYYCGRTFHNVENCICKNCKQILHETSEQDIIYSAVNSSYHNKEFRCSGCQRNVSTLYEPHTPTNHTYTYEKRTDTTHVVTTTYTCKFCLKQVTTTSTQPCTWNSQGNCINCNNTKPECDHSYYVTAVTWTDSHLTATIHYKCSHCNSTEDVSQARATSGQDASCTQDGYYECYVRDMFGNVHRCGVKHAYTPAHGHRYRETKIDATCTTSGKYIYKCEYCGDTYEEPIPSYGGHSYGEGKLVSAGTCTEKAKYKETCAKCGDTREMEGSIDANNHSDNGVYGGNDYEHWVTCRDCKQEITQYRGGHSYSKGHCSVCNHTCSHPSSSRYYTPLIDGTRRHEGHCTICGAWCVTGYLSCDNRGTNGSCSICGNPA